MKRIAFFWVITLVMIGGAWNANAAEFTVGVESINYYPYYDGSGDEYRGFGRDVLDLFAKEKGYTFKYVALPINRLYKSFYSKKIDFKFPDNPTWQKDKKKGMEIACSDPVIGYIDGVMVLPENKGKGIDHLKVLGTIRGFTAWDYLDLEKAGKVNIHENSSFDGLMKQAKIGRVDGAYFNTEVCKYRLKDKDTLVFDPDLPHTKSSYLLSSIKYPRMIGEMNTFIKNNQNAIHALKEKYGLKD